MIFVFFFIEAAKNELAIAITAARTKRVSIPMFFQMTPPIIAIKTLIR